MLNNIFVGLPDEILLKITRHAYKLWLYDSLVQLGQTNLTQPNGENECLCYQDFNNNFPKNIIIKDKANFIRVYLYDNSINLWSLKISIYSSKEHFLALANTLPLSIMPITQTKKGNLNDQGLTIKNIRISRCSWMCRYHFHERLKHKQHI